MEHERIGFCRRRIAEEERLGALAQSPVDAAAHYQLALLYKAQLRVLSGADSDQRPSTSSSRAA